MRQDTDANDSAGSLPWFEDPSVKDRVLTTSHPSDWREGQEELSIEMADVREGQQRVWSRCVPRVIPIFINVALFWSVAGLFASGLWDSVPQGLFVAGVFLTYLCGFAAVFALGQPCRELVVGHEVSLNDLITRMLRAYPRVLSATIVASSVVLIGLAFCILPGLFVLPFVLRAPYEAARGAGPLAALNRSISKNRIYRVCRDDTENVVTTGIVAALLWATALTELLSGPILRSVAISVAEAGILLTVWVGSMGAYLTTDAAVTGALREENAAKHRLERRGRWERLQSGRTGRVLRGAALILGLLVLIIHASWDDWKQLRHHEHAVDRRPLTDLEGQPHDLRTHRGTPTVLYAWAPWSKAHRRQTAELHELLDERGASVDVVSVVLGYSNRTEIDESLAETPVRYDVLVGDDAFAETHSLDVFPTVIVLDQNHRVLMRRTGVTRVGDILKTIDASDRTSRRGSDGRREH